MGDKTKHLVRVGHEFAAAMSDDTPIITIAKMVTELASALDVQSARSDALAAENAALKSSIKTIFPGGVDDEPCGVGFTDTAKAAYAAMKRTPATDAWVNEQRAVGVDSAIESAKKEIASEFQYQSFDNCISACARHPQSDLSGKVEMVAWLEWFAAQLRGSQA